MKVDERWINVDEGWMGVIASWKLGLRVGLRWIKIGWGECILDEAWIKVNESWKLGLTLIQRWFMNLGGRQMKNLNGAILSFDGGGWRLDWGESILDANWIEVNVLDEGGSCVFGSALNHGCKWMILGWRLGWTFLKAFETTYHSTRSLKIDFWSWKLIPFTKSYVLQ